MRVPIEEVHAPINLLDFIWRELASTHPAEYTMIGFFRQCRKLLIERIVWVVNSASYESSGKCEFSRCDPLQFGLGELTSTHTGEYTVAVIARHKISPFSFGSSPNIVGEIRISRTTEQ
jgi:hypothetical protein